MNTARATTPPLRHADRFFIGGEWVEPSSGATADVIDSGTEDVYYTIAAAAPDDMARAVAAARHAFDDGPWTRLTHAERAEYIGVLGAALAERGDVLSQLWPRELGVLYKTSQYAGRIGSGALVLYAALAGTFPFEEECPPTGGGKFGLLVREPVGVVGAIIPWNAPVALICHKIGPALLAGCTVVLKSAPEAPGEGYVFAEAAEQIGLPAGVLNVVTADREVSELLVRDSGVDKITFTGSTGAGRRIASLCGERIARCTLELGGKSAAVVLDDMDLATAATTLARVECGLNGQVCSSLTRVIVTKDRHDALVEALAASFGATRVGDPFDEESQLGPLVSERQRDRVLSYIAKGVEEGATLATGGGRPEGLGLGYYVEPTVFGNVDNRSAIGREEIFGPVLAVIKATDEQDAVRIANDSIYGLNASVFTNDVDRARAVARELRSGTVGHNAFRTDFGMAFGGFKQSGIGREGGKEGLLPFLETKTVILEGRPDAVRADNVNPRVRLDPEVAEAIKMLPFDDVTAEVLQPLRVRFEMPVSDRVERVDRVVPGDPEVPVRVHRARTTDGVQPCVLSIHGGGYVLGTNLMDDPILDELCPTLGILGVSVEYRLAPETPYPGPLEDCYLGLKWTHAHAEELGIDPDCIGVMGVSVGGGLAAALCLLARDRGEVPIAFQLLDQPMLDDRQITPSSREADLAAWTRKSNTFGWTAYLGDLYGSDHVPPTAAPARATDLSGLPPTFVSVGAADGFRDEDIDYALRLNQAGVPTELHAYPGACHGFNVMAPEAAVSKQCMRNMAHWLRAQLP